MSHSVAAPNILTDPGMLWGFNLGATALLNTVAGGVFTDDPPVAYVPFGATTEGSSFSYSTNVDAITVAEFFDPIRYATTERSGSIAFNLADFTLKNYKAALNGGLGAITPTSGTGATALNEFSPVDPGNEIRIGILWESTDRTVRALFRQAIQGGTVETAFRKAPSIAAIPCTFNIEIPAGGLKPFTIYTAGAGRG